MESEHAKKLREAGIRRYGSEEAWRESLRERSNKSSRNSAGTGGFASMDKEKHIAASRKGGKHRHAQENTTKS